MNEHNTLFARQLFFLYSFIYIYINMSKIIFKKDLLSLWIDCDFIDDFKTDGRRKFSMLAKCYNENKIQQILIGI